MTPPNAPDRVRIVLVEPLQPGNVGAAVRAMANTGLTDLVVVDPPAFDVERARWMAPGCDDLLARTRFVASLDEALVGAHRVVATTARHRKWNQPVIEPADLAESVWSAPEGHVTAVLFGREDFGLPTEAVLRCDALVRIPTPEHASLNLGQAVLIVAWCLYDEARRHGVYDRGRILGGHVDASTVEADRRGPRDLPADLSAVEPAISELIALLDRVGYTRSARPEKVAQSWRSVLARASATVREVEALRGVVGKIQRSLDRRDDPRDP